jgi:hypothetical protein
VHPPVLLVKWKRIPWSFPYMSPCLQASTSYTPGGGIVGDNPPCNTLFVGNLHDSINESELSGGGWMSMLLLISLVCLNFPLVSMHALPLALVQLRLGSINSILDSVSICVCSWYKMCFSWDLLDMSTNDTLMLRAPAKCV